MAFQTFVKFCHIIKILYEMKLLSFLPFSGRSGRPPRKKNKKNNNQMVSLFIFQENVKQFCLFLFNIILTKEYKMFRHILANCVELVTCA